MRHLGRLIVVGILVLLSVEHASCAVEAPDVRADVVRSPLDRYASYSRWNLELGAADRALRLGQDVAVYLGRCLVPQDAGLLWFERARIACLLGELEDPRAVGPLSQVVRQGPGGDWWPVRYNAIWALGRLRDPSVLPLLEEVLSEEKPMLVFDGLRDPFHPPVSMPVYQYAAQQAIQELTGEWHHFHGEEEFREPAAALLPFTFTGTVEGQGYAQNGVWAQRQDYIEGRSAETGRLWLPRALPKCYTLSVRVRAKEGMAGLSFGHLKDFLLVETQPSDFELTLWATETDFAAEARLAGTDVVGDYLSERDPRRVLLRTRRDLGRRVALVVEEGSAQFSEIRYWPGKLVSWLKGVEYAVHPDELDSLH